MYHTLTVQMSLEDKMGHIVYTQCDRADENSSREVLPLFSEFDMNLLSLQQLVERLKVLK